MAKYFTEHIYSKEMSIWRAQTINTGVGDIYLYQYPTGNCQVCSMSYVCNIINKSDDDVIAIFNDAYEVSGRSQILIDINDNDTYNAKIERVFKDNIVFKQPYESTNDHRMIMYLLKINNL